MEVIKAEKENSSDLAYLINLAGDGIPEYLWNQMKEGNETAMDVGARRAEREDGGFSYKNAMICKREGAMMGMILAYCQDDPYEIGDISEYPSVVRPLVNLESKAPGSWYINAIATFNEYRGKGVAKLLMADTEQRALSFGCRTLSLIVASENVVAKKLYESLGFRVIKSSPVVPLPDSSQKGDWLLMTKQI